MMKKDKTVFWIEIDNGSLWCSRHALKTFQTNLQDLIDDTESDEFTKNKSDQEILEICIEEAQKAHATQVIAAFAEEEFVKEVLLKIGHAFIAYVITTCK
jgi:hypothetical protein